MSDQTLCRAVASLLALVLMGPVVAPAGEVTDVRYSVEGRSEIGGVPPSPPGRTTYSVKGQRQRIDSAGHSQYTILQCDLGRLVWVDPDRNTCCVSPLYRGGAQSPTKATTTAKGGVVVFEGEYRDTGERQEMFGLKARRVEWKQVTTADANTCSQQSGRGEYAGDAWIADMPPSVRPYGCISGEDIDFETALRSSWAPGCKDDVQTKITGDPKLLMGLMLSGTVNTSWMQYTTKDVFKTTEFSTAPLDPAIFEVPKGCTCPSGLAAGPSGATAEKKIEPPLKLDVRETATEVKIALSAEVLFDFDKATLRPEAREPLEQVATLIRKYPDTKILVEGHTDALGSDEYNLSLSRRRSDSVRDWLVQVGSVPSARIETRGWGKSRPVTPNTNPDKSDNPEGRQKNRRVEITVKK